MRDMNKQDDRSGVGDATGMEEVLLETICMKAGEPLLLDYHIERMQLSYKEIYGSSLPWSTAEVDSLLMEAFRRDMGNDRVVGKFFMGGSLTEKFKARVLYGKDILRVEVSPYHKRKVDSLRCVQVGQALDYHLKYLDRTVFSPYLALKGKADDILMIRDGRPTDTSYSNIVLYDGSSYYTPSSFLLPGVKRRFLIEQGVVQEVDVKVGDLGSFQKIFLINAMLDLEDGVVVENLYLPDSVMKFVD